jgi:RNA polymerase sigma-70 factor (ECF subfamily)
MPRQDVARSPETDGMNGSGSQNRQQECAWVRSAQCGDADAFRRLVDVYDRRLLYFVRRFFTDVNAALDVCQDVWLTLCRQLPRLRAPEAFRVWLYQIAHDRVVSMLRRQARQEQRCEPLAGEPVAEDSGDTWETAEQAELIHHSLEALSSEHREILVLRFLEDLSLEEIAEALRLPVGTVKSRLHYARKALRQHLEKYVHE